MLVANRLKIVWCTKLLRAASDDETAKLEREMYNDPLLVDILGQLKATRASARDRKNAIIEEVREEARRLRTGEEGGRGGPEVVDSDVAARQVCLTSWDSCRHRVGEHDIAQARGAHALGTHDAPQIASLPDLAMLIACRF